MGSTSPERDSEVHRALPANWYSSPAMYDLERRAIYSKEWFLVTHKLRFNKIGDFVKFEEAGFAFFLCKNRQGEINGFHNICRHRAFPIVTKDCGTASILSCKYHGWSYGLNGSLAKAPKFDTVPSFDKASNSLFPIHVHVDNMGFVWVNLEASEKPSKLWGQNFKGVDLQERYKNFDVEKYKFDHTWSMMGDYNWKTLADNYNECYHCAVAHPGVSSVADLSAYSVETSGSHIQHFNKPKAETETSTAIASTFFFPNSSTTFSPDFFYLMRAVPVSAIKTSMEYEVYRHLDATDEAFTHINELFKQVLREDKDLCNNAQKNLNAGVFTNGRLHPWNEKGPLYFQKLVKNAVMTHREEEVRLDNEIWPAKAHIDKLNGLDEEISFCAGLSKNCSDGSLSW
ncbi:iron-sulfur cluster-binding protein [Bisporella sp. PMI_857]|nr:iron-sulfur cluster-binding protein [Bisporella sp. PMI_857]